jgi:ATP-binding cassette, subfamily B, bacterial
MTEKNKYFFSYFKGKQAKILKITLCVLFSTIVVVLNPLITSYVIDNYIIKRNLDGLSTILLLAFGINIINMFINYTSTVNVGELSQEIMFKLRNEVFQKIQQLPMNFFMVNESGDIIARVNNDTRKIDNMLSRYIFEFITSFFTFIGIGLFIFTQNIVLAILTWVFVIILIVFSRLIGGYVTSSSVKQLETGAKISTFLNENITNYKAVVAFNQIETINNEFEVLVKNNFRKSLVSKFLTSFFRPLYNFAGQISVVIVVIAGVYLLSIGTISAGVLISFVFYVQRFYEPINRLSAVYGSFEQAQGSWSRIYEVLTLDKNNIIMKKDLSHQLNDIDD